MGVARLQGSALGCIFAPLMRVNTVASLAEKIRLGLYKTAVITTHHKPDGDALGSSLGLYLFLKRHIKKVHVVSPTDYPEFLSWLPGNEDVRIFEGDEAACTQLVREASLVFCLDFNRLSRINDLGEIVRTSEAQKILIDHHLDPENFEDHTYWDNHASSTAELVFDFICNHYSYNEITPEIATCLYTGLMTDTGNFRHVNTTAHTHRVAGELIDAGVQHTEISERIFDVFSPTRSKLFGYCMYEKLEIIPELRTALICLSKEELERFQVVTGDTEGLVNLGLNIENVVLSVLIIDRSKLVKMSFRSKGDFAVNEYAEKHFSGGGHKNASGGQSEDSLENTVAKFRETIKLYEKELNAL